MQTRPTRDLVTISLAFFLVFLGAGAAQPFVIDYLHQGKGIPATQASLVLSLVYFVFVVFWVFVGRIVDLIGLHAVKILGVATYALFPFIVYASDSYPVLLMASVMWGIGASMFWASSMVQVMNTSTRYASATGIIKGAEMSGAMLGAYLLSVVYTRHGYEAVFVVAAALGVGGLLAMAASPNRKVAPGKPNFAKFVALMKRPRTKTVCGLLLASGFAYGIILNGMKSHIETACGDGWLRFILPVFAVTGILASVFGGRVCDHVGRWLTFTWAFAIGAAGMWLAAATGEPALLMLAMLAIGVQNALVPLSALGWIGDHTEPHERAQVIGFVLCYRDFGVALAIQLGGIFTETRTAFVVFGALSAACTLAALRAMVKTRTGST